MNTELRYLESLQWSGIRPGLKRVRALLRAAGSPQQSVPTIIVAGTNGKGSVASTLASILHASGYRTGFYSSPHLVDLRERWQIDGSNVSMEALQSAVRTLQKASEACGVRPTWFEALTVIAFVMFATEECDVAVVETGLGGRLDATNVTRPIAALITSIGFDHQEYLGNTLRKIATEKAGVIHRGAITLTSNVESAVIDVLRRRTSTFDAQLHETARETSVDRVRFSDDAMRFRLQTPAKTYSLSTPLVGRHQLENLALAVRAAEELQTRFQRVSSRSITRGVAATRWRGRLERFDLGAATVWVDGGHNEQAARRVAEFVEERIERPRALVFAMMRDKDIETVARTLFPRFDTVIVTCADQDRGATVAQLQEAARSIGLRARGIADPCRAVEAAIASGTRSILVCGSLYLAGAVIPKLSSLRHRRESGHR